MLQAPFESKAKKVKQWVIEPILVRLVTSFLNVSKRNRARSERRSGGAPSRTVVLTGTYYSENWLLTHVVPLTLSKSVDRVIMISDQPVPQIDGLVGIVVTGPIRRIFGATLSRLIIFYRTVQQERPFLVGGFHLLLNGLVALAAAASAGSKSLYICGGGPREVVGGGYETENRLFRSLPYPSKKVEESLLRVVNEVDLVVVMGRSAHDYFLNNGVTSQISIHAGGIDAHNFGRGNCEKSFDLSFVGRLSSVKRPNLFLNVLSLLRTRRSNANAVIVGDGPLMEEVKLLMQSMGLESCVHLVGWTDDVAYWLQRSRTFVMTSESEGLSQALIQAGLCGLPAVVSDVGDLSDLVEDGKNGYLIASDSPEAYVRALEQILGDLDRYEGMALCAYARAQKYSLESATRRWDEEIFSELLRR